MKARKQFIGKAKQKGKRPYDTSRWRRSARNYRKQHPLCEINGPNCTRLGECVDHIKPHRYPAPGWYERFWSADNWQTACNTCHDEKTKRGQ